MAVWIRVMREREGTKFDAWVFGQSNYKKRVVINLNGEIWD